jgi:hypothetical protein
MPRWRSSACRPTVSRLTAEDFPRLVLDANVMVSALAGTSFPLLLRLYSAGVVLMAPVQQWAETRHVLRDKMGLPQPWVDEQVERLREVVLPIHPGLLEPYRERAQRRLHARGMPDWPVLAATYAVGGAAWSRDKDLFGTGAAVWFTRVLKREAELLPATDSLPTRMPHG